jgi:hypothetical protein
MGQAKFAGRREYEGTEGEGGRVADGAGLGGGC